MPKTKNVLSPSILGMRLPALSPVCFLPGRRGRIVPSFLVGGKMMAKEIIDFSTLFIPPAF